MDKHRIQQILLLTSVSAFAFVFAIEQVYNYDIWWHLRSGEWILNSWSIPTTDPFSFSTFGAYWANTAWLSGLFFAVIEKYAGLDFLIFCKALLIAASSGGIFIFLIRRSVNPYLAAFVIVYAVVVARFRFLLRPMVFMFPFAIALLWILSGPASRKEKISFLLIPVALLWTNLHGSSYLAPIFAGFLLLERLIQWIQLRAGKKDTVFPSFELLLLFLICCAVLITPFGLEVPRLIIERFVFKDLVERSYSVQEHLPLVWGTHTMYWILMITTFVSFVLNWRSSRLFFFFVFVGTSWLALGSVRYVGLAAFLQAPLLALNVQSLFQRYLAGSSFLSKKSQHIVMPFVLLIFCVVSFRETFSPDKVYKWGIGINKSRFPLDAVHFLKKSGFEGNLYNSWQDGGYIIWNLKDSKTFIDGRCLPEQLELFEQVASKSAHEFQLYLDNNNVQGALLPKTENEVIQFFEISPRFVMSYYDDKSLVFLNREFLSMNTAVDLQPRLQYIKPQSYDISYLVPLAQGPEALKVERELRSAVSLNQDSFTLVFQLAFFLDLTGNPESVEYYMKAAELNPSLGFSHFNLGVLGGRAAVKHNRWAKAVDILQLAIKNGTQGAEIYFLLGNAYYKLQSFSKAESAFKESLAKQPDNPISIMNLGYVYIDTQRFEEARKYFARALLVMPNLEGASYGYALSLQKSGDAQAPDAWKKFINSFPDSRWAPVAKDYLSNNAHQ